MADVVRATYLIHHYSPQQYVIERQCDGGPFAIVGWRATRAQAESLMETDISGTIAAGLAETIIAQVHWIDCEPDTTREEVMLGASRA